MDAQTPPEDELRIPPLDSPRRRRIAIGAVATLAVGGLVAFLLSRGGSDSPYRVDPVTETAIVKEIRVTGHLELIDQVEVPAPIEGQLVSVLVRSGDTVEEGQLIAQLDRAAAELAYHVARAELHGTRARVLEAEAAHERATESLQRTTRLAAKDLASKSTLEQSRTAATKARAGLQAARAEQSAAVKRASMRERERDRTDIVAPRAGLILEAPRHTGMVVGPDHRLFRIGAAPDKMLVVAPVGEADIGAIATGQTATFEAPAFPGRVFEATVQHVSPDPSIEAGAVFYPVTLVTGNSDRALLPGMTAQVRIKTAQVDGVLAVREAALRFTPDGVSPAPPRSRIWRVHGSELEEIIVRTGLSDGAFTEVRTEPPHTLEVGNPIAIGIATERTNDVSPGVSLRGRK